MTGELADTVKNAACAGDVVALREFVAAHGAPSVRLDGNPDELTSLHWAAASGVVEAVNYLLSAEVQSDPRATRNNNFSFEIRFRRRF